MNEKGKLITEKDIEELALKKYKENIKFLQEKEKYISQMPYSEEYPRFFTNKYNTCHTIILRSFWYSMFVAVFLATPFAMSTNSKNNLICDIIN